MEVTNVSLRKSYRLACDFCRAKGPERDTEALATAGAASCPRRIARVHRSFYGNEVFACADCLRTDEEARRWAEGEVVANG
jgi:hypothetical protein